MFGQQDRLPKIEREALSDLIDKSGVAEKIKAHQRHNAKASLQMVCM